MDNKSILKSLYEKYGLIYDTANPGAKSNDIYVHKHYTIITRQGIQKVESKAGIKCHFTLIPQLTQLPNDVAFEVNAIDREGNTYQTFASVSEATTNQGYKIEMCEKRGRSRAVLTLAGLYEQGVFGEDESDSFSKEITSQQETVGAKVKGA